MTPLIADVDFGLIFGLGIPVAAIVTVALTAILTGHRRKMQRDDMEATLKMEMIQRGMGADEIERVLGARMGHQSRFGRRHAAQDHQHYWQQYEQSPTQRS
jgi:hypothetical protein